MEKYLATRGPSGPWEISGCGRRDFDGAVIIPSLAESQTLFITLESLARNPRDTLSRFLVLVVVNHRQESPLSEKKDNEETLKKLSAGGPFLEKVQLGWVDAASPGRELPEKGGVGLARKIGFDLALPRLDFRRGSPILISLDADTLCRPDYLPAIIRHFKNSALPGAVIPFCHQAGDCLEQDQAIRRYELFLRAYVLGLARAGSPYGFHTVGSAMACTAAGYIRIGGMKALPAAEDFYFLEHLGKEGGVAQVKGTVVYPSARSSNRVPFGTGRSMSRLLAKEEGAVLFYQAECYRVLADWLNLMGQSLGEEGSSILSRSAEISRSLHDYLCLIRFEPLWNKLRNNFKSDPSLSRAFHRWFDGLKTMKLIHHLSAGSFPRNEPEAVVPGLLSWAGLDPVSGIDRQLDLLREIQNGGEYSVTDQRLKGTPTSSPMAFKSSYTL